MDWLSKYHASIDYFCKIVIFTPVDQPPFVFQGSEEGRGLTINSTINARKLLKKGCASYLASLVGGEGMKPSLEDIPMLCQYSNRFPKDLPGQPPNREVHFTIDLVPGTAPISKAPYRMALA